MPTTFTTWNIYRGTHFELILETLRKINPDVIALQEVSEIQIDGHRVNVAEALARELGCAWHYCKSVAVTRGSDAYEIGNALLSKKPFVRKSCIALNDAAHYDQTVSTEPRTACRAELQLGNTQLTVISTHIFHPHHEDAGAATQQQISKLLTTLTDHTVLMGDFNNEGTSAALEPLTARLTNTGGYSKEPTFINIKYNMNEKRRFDHIFATPALKVKDYTVQQSEASDHMPVTAVIDL
jgi:endonuclease/exonuclease/phosphatase family metal-dependent hydrolase